MRTLLISLLAGLLGGALGAALLVAFLPLTSVPTAVSTLPITSARRSSQAEFQIAQAKASIIPFIKPSLNDTFSSFEKAVGAGIALTSDGLIVSPVAIKNTSGLKGVSSDDLPFPLAAALGKEGKPIVLTGTGLTLLKPASGTLSPQLKPATLSGFEDLEVGQSVFSVNAIQQISWHHIAALYPEASVTQPLSSEDPQGGFFMVDTPPVPGAFLFNAEGQLIGIAMEKGEIMPAEWIAAAVRQYLRDGTYRPVALGISFVDLSHVIALVPEYPKTGIRIEGDRTHRAIIPGLPASVAGLRAGDILTVFDGRRLDGRVPLPLLLQRYSPGTEVEIVVLRGGKEEKVKVVLGPK